MLITLLNWNKRHYWSFSRTGTEKTSFLSKVLMSYIYCLQNSSGCWRIPLSWLLLILEFLAKCFFFPLHHLGDFKPEEFFVLSLPRLCRSNVRDCKKMTLKASLANTVSFSPDGYNLHARGPLSPPAFSWCYEEKKKSKFLRVWNAFPGNWQQSSSQVYDLDSNLDFPYAFLTLWKMGWKLHSMCYMPPAIIVLLLIEFLKIFVDNFVF